MNDPMSNVVSPEKGQDVSVKNRFSPRTRVISPKGEKPAKQEFKDDADLNSIMRKFQKTGAIAHHLKYGGSYGVATPQTLHEAMTVVSQAETMFAELPSSLRERFRNEPSRFLEFVQDETNLEEMYTLGLAERPSRDVPLEPSGTATSPAATVSSEAADASGTSEASVAS